VRKSAEKYSKFNVKVECDILKAAWDNRKSMKTNLAALGVASDANKSVKKIKSHKLKFVEEDISDEDMSKGVDDESKSSGVVEKLMKEAAIKKPPTFRFSSEQVKWISSMMDKHKFNFKAMARDPSNHFQETPRAIQHKVRKFMSIPDHYVPYCRERGLLDAVKLPEVEAE